MLVPQDFQDRPPLQTTVPLQHTGPPLQRGNEKLAVFGTLDYGGGDPHMPTTLPNATS